MDYLSKKQLETIANINKYAYRVDFGPFGCGKTYSIMLGLGLLSMRTKPMENDSVIALIGRTMQTCKRNMCNVLSTLFGDDFKYTNTKKDGYEKDALLFGHKIFILGANDKSSEERIRGMNCYAIVCDEVSLWKEEIFNLVMGRLRGPIPDGWGQGFMLSATNPGSPKNYLKLKMDSQKDKDPNSPGYIHFEQWKSSDIITDNSKLYYENLKELYKNNLALLKRYVYGEWAAADGLVYPEFDEKEHVIDEKELENAIYTEYRIGLDFGADHPTAVVLIGVMPAGEQIVLKELKESNLLVQDLILKLNEMIANKEAYLTAIYIDPSAKAIRNELSAAGYGNLVKKAVNDVTDGIQSVKQDLQSGKLYISSNCTQLIDEFYIYQYKEGDSEKLNVVKLNDDLMDALRYAIYSPKFK